VIDVNSKFTELRPPRIAQFLVVAAGLLHWAAAPKLHLYSNALLGSVIIAIGLYVMLAAWWLFKKRRTAICPTDTPSNLVVEGIYRVTRNPMYLGIVAMLLGLAMIVGSLPFYLAAMAYMLVINSVFCAYEEEKLLRQFGDDYLHYKNRVRRWL